MPKQIFGWKFVDRRFAFGLDQSRSRDSIKEEASGENANTHENFVLETLVADLRSVLINHGRATPERKKRLARMQTLQLPSKGGRENTRVIASSQF